MMTAKTKKKAEKPAKKARPVKAVKKEKKDYRDIGIPISNPPAENCGRPDCPYHGSLKIRGRTLKGKVVSTKMAKSVVVRYGYASYVPKYKRYEKKRTRLVAHKPPCIQAREGDVVRIAECRPISKTKSFVVMENLSLAQKKGER